MFDDHLLNKLAIRSQAEVAEMLGISRVTVAATEKRALQKLRRLLASAWTEHMSGDRSEVDRLKHDLRRRHAVPTEAPDASESSDHIDTAE